MNQIFEDSAEIFCQLDQDGKIRHVNRRWTEQLGWHAEDLRGRNFADFIHDDDLAGFTAAWPSLFEEPQALPLALRFHRARGDFVFISWRLAADAETQMVYGWAQRPDAATDEPPLSASVTRSHGATVANAASPPFRWPWYFMHEIGEAVLEADLVSGRLHCSAMFWVWSGGSPQGFDGTIAGARAWLHPDDEGPLLAAIQACLDGKIPCCKNLFRLRRADGTFFWVYGRAIVSGRDAQGKALRVMGSCIEVTDWKQEEDTLHAILSSMDDLMLVVDGDLRYRRGFASTSYLDLINPQQVMGKSLWEAHGEPFATALGAKITKTLATGATSLWEFRHPNGSNVWFSAKITVIPDRLDKGERQVSIFIRDITLHKRDNDALRVERERLSLALRSMHFGVWDWNTAENTVVWDESQFSLYGQSPEIYQPTHTNWLSLVHPDDVAMCVETLDKAIASEDYLDMTYRIYNPLRGEWRWVRDNAYIQRDKEQNLVRMVGLNWDTTERIRAEALIKAQKQFIENIMNAVPDPIFVKDMQHRWIYSNEAFSTLMGLSPSSYLGHADVDFRGKEMANRTATLERHVMQMGKSREVEQTYEDREGESRSILTKMTPSTDLDGNPIVVGVIRDITERKRLEQAIEVERGKVAHSSKLAALGQMAGGIAHEINNPLAVIYAAVRRLKREGVTHLDDVGFARTVDMIERTTERIAKIIRGLQLFARDGEGDPFTLVPIGNVLEDTLSVCRQRLYNEEIRLTVNLWETDTVVECRAVQISQILLNLINNACDAVQGLPDKWIDVSSRDADDQVEIAVTDAGKGISPELVYRIMEPFFTTKDINKGTGLGLSISLGIAKSHMGSLWVDRSAPHTRFVLRLPKRQPQPETLALRGDIKGEDSVNGH